MENSIEKIKNFEFLGAYAAATVDALFLFVSGNPIFSLSLSQAEPMFSLKERDKVHLIPSNYHFNDNLSLKLSIATIYL